MTGASLAAGHMSSESLSFFGRRRGEVVLLLFYHPDNVLTNEKVADVKRDWAKGNEFSYHSK